MTKRHRVSWTEVATRDLDRIFSFLAGEARLNALKGLDRLEEEASRLETVPGRGRVVPELRWHGIDRYRELQVAPWRIIYRHDEKAVVVVAVLDGRRSLEDVLLDRFLET